MRSRKFRSELARSLCSRLKSVATCFVTVAVLSACGGGGGGGETTSQATALGSTDGNIEALGVVVSSSNKTTTSGGTLLVGSAIVPATSTVTKPATRHEAARFLTQATFGPTAGSIDRLMSMGYEPWLREQLGAAVAGPSYLDYWDRAYVSSGNVVGIPKEGGWVDQSFWRHALSSPDQLRHRVAFALSQIFVVSIKDACGDNVKGRGVATFMDMLGQQGFGSYRRLLESVALHPTMGCFLSHVANQKEDAATGREPDQNFAREVMQLFSIGLYELNKTGVPKLDVSGNPVETYTTADVVGLSKVFTGWSWNCGDFSDRCFLLGIPLSGSSLDRWSSNMVAFSKFHSVAEKRFLGVTVPAQTTANPAASLKAALDRLASHPNVAPFLGKQLIQRLVTANPSEQYVARVSAAFDQSGGNLGAMVYAVLMDPEARNMGAAMASATFGKPREPVLKLSAFLRAYGATSTTGAYLMSYLDDPAYALGQSPLRSATVFNFFRPGYVLPGSSSAASRLVTPEFQLMDELSVAGYANFMSTGIYMGFGRKGYDGTAADLDIRTAYQRSTSEPVYALADTPINLVEDINNRLMYGQMSQALKDDIVYAVTQVDHRSKTSPTADQIASTRRTRLWTALLLTLVSPEYQIQR